MENIRFLTLKLLNKTFQKDSFSNIVLDNALNEHKLSDTDRKFCSILYYGVLERKITLDHIISCYSKKSILKLDIEILNILRCGIYQLKYMDSVPDNASVDESVKLTKKIKKTSASGFVNAVLRCFIRDNKEIRLPEDDLQSCSIEYSSPLWLVKKLKKEYNEDYAISLLESSIQKPPITIRLNPLKADKEKLTDILEDVQENPLIPNCFILSRGDITKNKAFKTGMFHVQDIASQLCCMALNPQENEIVLDLCSAPGGKAFTIAELMNGTGSVYAFDLHESRVNLIQSGAKRLGLENIKAMQGDALVFNEKLPLADKILCDVPCSGLGVIRRKPEIKYKNPDEFKDLPQIQYNILENAVKYLKIGGELIYSTCTLNLAENDEVIEKFLENHKNFKGIEFLSDIGKPFGENNYKVTLIPAYFNSDGFFISKIKRME